MTVAGEGGSGGKMELNLRNILLISVSFMLLDGAYYTTAGISQIVLESAREDDPSVTAHGYISLAINYAVFAVSSFFAPSIVKLFGVRNTLFYGSTAFIIFVASFIYPDQGLIYGTSALLGFASSSVFVANGCYLTKNSTKESIGKCMGIYWTIMSIGQLFGNLLIFFCFQGSNHIDYDTRVLVIAILTCICIASSCTLKFLGPAGVRVTPNDRKKSVAQLESNIKPNMWTLFLEPFRLLRNKNMLLLIPASVFNGFEMAYFEAILPTTVGFTEAFGGDVRKWVGIAGILTALGSLVGGLVFGAFGDKLVKSNRSVIVSIASTSFCLAAVLIYLNHPEGAPLGPTADHSIISPPQVPISLLCAFLLGLGEGCLSTQISAAIGVIWPDDPSAPLAIFRLFQGSSCAIFLYVGTLTGLSVQLILFVGVCLLGEVTFVANEFMIKRQYQFSFTLPPAPASVRRPSVWSINQGNFISEKGYGYADAVDLGVPMQSQLNIKF